MIKIYNLCIFICFLISLEKNFSCDSSSINSNGFCPENVKTAFVPISCGVNLYTQYHKKPKEIDDSIKSTLSLTYRFARTNNSNEIAKTLFQYNPLFFQGYLNDDLTQNLSRIENRALIPEYFGLSPSSNTSIYLKPVIQNQIFDLQFSLDSESYWIQFNLPIVYSSWRMNYENPYGSSGLLPFQGSGSLFLETASTGNLSTKNTPLSAYSEINSAAEFNTSVNKSNLTIDSNFTDNQSSPQLVPIQYWQNNISELNSDCSSTIINNISQSSIINSNKVNPAKNIFDALNGYTFGDVQERLYNKLYLYDYQYHSTEALWGIADFITQIGVDFIKTSDKYLAFYAKMIIPMGNKLDESWAEYAFSPIVGNGRHFELGGGLSGSLIAFECSDKIVKLIADGYIVHSFNANQFRSFDLCNQPMSRYSIMKSFYNNTCENYTLSPEGDINSLFIPVGISFRGEGVLDLTLEFKKSIFGIGYSISGQSKEKINGNVPICGKIQENKFGFKGLTSQNNLIVNKTPDESTPTIWNISNIGEIEIARNENISNSTNSAYNYGQIEASNEENTFLLPKVNNSGLMNAQILQRVFFHLDINFDFCSVDPFVGILGSYGFNSNDYITAKYWDLGFKIGVLF